MTYWTVAVSDITAMGVGVFVCLFVCTNHLHDDVTLT